MLIELFFFHSVMMDNFFVAIDCSLLVLVRFIPCQHDQLGVLQTQEGHSEIQGSGYGSLQLFFPHACRSREVEDCLQRY